MIQSLGQMHLLIAALLMAGDALIASIPSFIYMFYERWAEERARREAEEASRTQSTEGRRTARA